MSCSSCGATTGTVKSGSSARRCCRISATDRILADARAQIARYEPLDAQERARNGSVIVDLRSHDERVRDGVIPGSVHVPRSVLEWRADPGSGFSNPHFAELDSELILFCREGYSSSLAAASLRGLGRAAVADLIGGFEAWRDAGLETVAAPAPPEGLPGLGGPD
jgi:rhodanese-related sulfurtransferase